MQVRLKLINRIQKRVWIITLIHTLGSNFLLLGSLLQSFFNFHLFVLLEMILPIFDFIIQLTFMHRYQQQPRIIYSNQMIKITNELDTNGSISELFRCNNIITGYDGVQDLLEVDVKHELIVRKKLQYPPTNVKCFNWQGKWEYFIITLNKIEIIDGGIMSASNSKSEFTGCIDCSGESLIFSKYHHNYKKYSINYLWEGTKKIIKLIDTPVKKLIFNPFSYQVIYNTKDLVNCLDINNMEKEVQLFKKSTFLADNSYLYTLSLNLQSKAKEQYEVGIFDFRTGKNSDSFLSKDPPFKMESFSRSLLVATKNAIQFYDLRKLIKPFDRELIKGIKDFLYEPNINKLFVGCQTKLRVYRSEN